MPTTQIPTTEPQGVEAYFTDVVHLRESFKNALAAPTLAKRLLIIYGVGGVGKSSLLRMFRLHCKNIANVPVALASGEDAKSPMDVLADWANDLNTDKVVLPMFAKTFEKYRTLQAKAENAAGKITDKVTKGAAKTIIETAASTIPIAGPLLGTLGGIGAEALIDRLRGAGFSKADIDLLLDSAKKMTGDFLADLTKIAAAKRIVLMLDTYEQMTVLDDWMCDLAQKLPANVLLIIAGREMVDWDRQWNGWLAQADTHLLDPMTPEVMSELVRRYYSTVRGGEPDPAQVEKIIRFARGLPIAVTTAVYLWVKHHTQDFDEVEADALDELVKRLREGVPPSIIPILEAAAAVRYFNKEILRAVTGQADVNAAYDELRLFPFVKPGKEGLQPVLRLHDSVREFIDRDLQVDDPERYRELHERAAAYFETRLIKATSEDTERLGLERLYHIVRANEETGIQLFQKMAEELAQYRLVNRLRVLLNDANTYSLNLENSILWREYYNARLVQYEGRLTDAQKAYQAINNNPNIDKKLRAYALCDFGGVLEPFDPQKAVQVLEKIPTLGVPLDSKLTYYLIYLSFAYRQLSNWNNSIKALEKAGDQFENLGDIYGQVDTLYKRRCHFLDWGLWKDGLHTYREVLETLPKLSEHSFLQMELFGGLAIAWAWMGAYADGERNVKTAILLAEQSGITDRLLFYYRDLALLQALQGKMKEAERWLDNSIRLSEETHSRDTAFGQAFQGVIAIESKQLSKADEYLTSSIEKHKNWKEGWILPIFFIWRGVLFEITREWARAEQDYRECLDMKAVRRLYHQCAAFTGLVRVKHAQGDYAAIPSLLAEAEQLAQQYDYNDHLASLRLTQAHIAWEGKAPAWENGFDSALHFYQHALIYALRYNRFLLDEMLSGRPQGTPLRPIIPHCLERGVEGKQMLIALSNWWRTGVNDIGTPRPDTISPIPEGIILLNAEEIARQREPGDGSPQKRVLEQIEKAL